MRVPQRLTTAALVAVISHTVLLTLAPFLQGLAGLRTGWSGDLILLAVFLIGPIAAGALARADKPRFAGIMLASFLPASAYTSVEYLLPLVSSAAPTAGSPAFSFLYQAGLVSLTVADVFGTIVAFALLKAVHAPTDISPES